MIKTGIFLTKEGNLNEKKIPKAITVKKPWLFEPPITNWQLETTLYSSNVAFLFPFQLVCLDF